MIKYLKDINAIDYHRLLILKSKKLGISSEECLVLLYILELNKAGFYSVTPNHLLEYMTFTSKQIDFLLEQLLHKRLVSIVHGAIQTSRLEEYLLQETPKEIERVTTLLESFEAEFGRALTPTELEALRSWKEDDHYDDDRIIQAMQEASKAGVLTIRYINGILVNWQKTGIRIKYTSQEEPEDTLPVSNYQWLNQ